MLIVAVVSVSPRVSPLVGLKRLAVNVSGPSVTPSSTVLTLTMIEVSPARNVSVLLTLV